MKNVYRVKESSGKPTNISMTWSMGEKLMVYLAVNDEVVSSILIKEGTEDQLLIYFISKPLQGAKREGMLNVW